MISLFESNLKSGDTTSATLVFYTPMGGSTKSIYVTGDDIDERVICVNQWIEGKTHLCGYNKHNNGALSSRVVLGKSIGPASEVRLSEALYNIVAKIE